MNMFPKILLCVLIVTREMQHMKLVKIPTSRVAFHLDFHSRQKILDISAMIVLPKILLFALFIIKATSPHEKRTGKAEKKCKEYVKYACDNQPALTTSETPSSILDAIRNGLRVSLEVLPHMAVVKLFKKVDSTSAFVPIKECSGTLISDNFILSAGHCAHDVARIDTGSLGIVKLRSVSQSIDGTGERYDVIEMYTHPNYSEVDSENRNDILLLKLDRKVKFSPYTRPICLNTKMPNNLSKAIISGWGDDENGNRSEYLQSALTYINDYIVKLKCNLSLAQRWFNDNTEICAGHPNETTGVGSGDSGGPMQIPMNTGCPYTYEQIGINSRTIQHKEVLVTMSIHTTVEPYIPWIESIVWPDE